MLKKAVAIRKAVSRMNTTALNEWVGRVSFKKIMLFWIGMIILFGFAYHFFSNDSSYLYNNLKKAAVDTLSDSIYFSFVSATTTGFGDIVPLGYFKIISVIELVFGLLILALVTSKLVSIKQDVILSELYELSFNEKIVSLRSSLLLFRQNINRLITKIDDDKIKKWEIGEIWTYISSFEDMVADFFVLLQRPGNTSFTKMIDPVNIELIFNSVLSSLEKVDELLKIVNEKKIDWKKEMTSEIIIKCLNKNNELFEKLNSIKPFAESKAKDLIKRKNEIMQSIQNELKTENK